MDKMIEPCPFCGGKAEVSSYHSCDCCGKAWNGSVTCQVCGASRDHYDTDAEAIAAWNQRAYNPDDRLREALERTKRLICRSLDYSVREMSDMLLAEALKGIESALSPLPQATK